MKQRLLFLIMALLGSSLAGAQSLSLFYEGEQLANGQEVEIVSELNEDPYYEMIAFAQVKNNTDREVSVMVRRITHSVVDGTENQFCWSACYPPFVDVSSVPYPIPGNEMTPEGIFSGHYLPQSKTGTSVLEYSFFIEGDPNDSISFVVKFKVEAVGLADRKEKASISNAYPNPANGMVNFDLDLGNNERNARLVIQNLLGQPLLEQVIEPGAKHLSIPVSELREGVYFYTLYIDNKNIVSKKLVIRR
ncbi:MAG: T9SS type A sorting domain-containing protein [Bacteroidales bacterium]|nr:T9SS type A sorting domain-containing protein [Bacteroidales bacterium]